MKRIVIPMAIAGLLFAAVPHGAQAAEKKIDWKPCAQGQGVDPRQECASVKVPLDHDNPHGEQITLAVSRIATASPGRRRGVLLLIPGGPGGSSINKPSAHVKRLPKEVSEQYDLVGFDPRGVGGSSPVSCDMDPADLSPSLMKGWPGKDGDITGNVAWARRAAQACADNGGDVLRGMSTRTEARDIDSLRAALGERKLSYWGVSYGTYVGAVYATMFPQRTDRVVLDSNDDPDHRRVARGWLENYGVAVEDRFPEFAAWAAARADTYGLGDTSEAVRKTFLGLAERLDEHPLPWPGSNPPELNGNVLRETMLNALYSDTTFPALAGLMKAGLGKSPLPEPQQVPEAALQNTLAVVMGTICNDVEWPRSVSWHQSRVLKNRAEYPLTAGMPVAMSPCSFWPAPEEPAVRVTSHGPSNILLINNLRDPSTPYSGALEMRRALGDRAVMVAVDSGGHGAYLANGNACGDRTVSRFLADGSRPRHDTVCR
ncbi:alpha/beta fold hydrolase [Nonomuraea sp. K274]|uniref:Alpha/beta fold hydrolase n=1 Tax=Nonomuraea cypriaca TaxID=1187855 RepID=A0A931A509_9ACTN|nr:alpha/beta hydrolase [Nonomuraea cypriaca]MBF8184203.1 alpha/beta fold hydrolase [Nonomuraea cypriaca]